MGLFGETLIGGVRSIILCVQDLDPFTIVLINFSMDYVDSFTEILISISISPYLG